MEAKRLHLLNELFAPLSPAKRITTLYQYFDPSEVMFTSSFGATSVVLLHMMRQNRPSQKVHFLDTTYHFAETLAYKKMVSEQFGLQVEDIYPDPTQNQLTKDEETYKDDPNLCCMVNKIVPMDAVKVNYKVWISGLIGYQTHFRSGMGIFDENQGMIKFNPLIDLTHDQVKAYVKKFDLPQHPLKARGYHSIGCKHCTIKGEGRNGRWQGNDKTECGLHVDTKPIAKSATDNIDLSSKVNQS